MKRRSAEVQRAFDDFEERLPPCFRKAHGPKGRKFNTAGYQIFRDEQDKLIFNDYTDTQLDILHWVWELGLRSFKSPNRCQEYLTDMALDLSAETGDPADVLHVIQIQVTTSFEFVLMDKRNLSDHA
jgi:hypothetical protein